jgi:hypothetical protein
VILNITHHCQEPLESIREQIVQFQSHTPPPKKCSEVRGLLKGSNVLHGNMKKFVELLLSLSGSNASIEKLFSHIHHIWSEVMSECHVETIQAIIENKY